MSTHNPRLGDTLFRLPDLPEEYQAPPRFRAILDIDTGNQIEVMTAIARGLSLTLGLSLPDTAISAFRAGETWTDISQPPNPCNRHHVLVTGYTPEGPVCSLRGRRQQMTWEFFERYADEAICTITPENAAENIDRIALAAVLVVE